MSEVSLKRASEETETRTSLLVLGGVLVLRFAEA